jgi:arylsulfatase A-like enzyme/dienelactone hydrolase
MLYPSFRNLCLLAATCFVLLSGGPAEAVDQNARDSNTRPPNIVFVLLDNVGKDWFRCYGSQEDQTPVIDQLAYNGLKFRNFYITPVCSTSRTMLLTGRYPFRTGWHTHHDSAIYGGGHLDWNREVSFARVLRDAGYSTCIAGKWQVNDLFDPAQTDALQRHGFDEHCIFPEGKPGHPAHKKRYWEAYLQQNGKRIDTTGRFGPDVVVDFAIDYMRRHRDEPFLLFYPAILTHIPVTTTPLAADETATARTKFANMVRYADHLVGRLVEALDALKLRDNTLVIITTDNGTDNGTDQGNPRSLGGRINGRIAGEGIYSLRETGINVPFIVSGPKWIPQGRETDALINAADILPTLADLAGAKLPGEVTIDGQSFASLVRDGSDDGWQRPWTFTQYSTTRVIRDQRYKLYSTGEFYDLAANPFETIDLSLAASTPGSPTMEAEAAAARNRLQGVLDAQPADAEWPFVFRSISARKIRAQQDAARREEWIRQRRRPPTELAEYFQPVDRRRGSLGSYRSPLEFHDGGVVQSADDWRRRRQEIEEHWQQSMGPWPELIATPRIEAGPITRRENITQRQLRIEIGLGGEMVDAFLLIPDGDGPFPAVIDVYYDAQTGVGKGTPQRDFAWQLAKRGFVTLAIGKPNTGVNLADKANIPARGLPYFGPVGKPLNVQPLSALAYAAANAHTVLSQRPEVYPDRIGIVGHSFGGKWALMAACLHRKFSCAVWSDPGIVFDERDRRRQNAGGSVNYWDRWYLGAEQGGPVEAGTTYAFRKLPGERAAAGEPARTGAYKSLVEGHHDLVELHALMAPRPFLVSGGTADLPERWAALNHSIAVNSRLRVRDRVAMTSRATHSPTEESNGQIYRFFEWWLMERE